MAVVASASVGTMPIHASVAAPSRGRVALIAVGIGVLAAFIRAAANHWGHGLIALGNYDDGVYFSAATALVHGLVPYRDFLLIQPPGLILALSPFAAAGRLIGDADALIAARIAFMVIGGANAALVAVTLRRQGVPAMLIGGLTYAGYTYAIANEHATLLEPLANLAMLIALAILTGRPRTRWLVVAGLALGFAVGVKITYAAPVLVILALEFRRIRPILIGTAAALAAVYLPFFLQDPAGMWRQVVLDQFGRVRIAHSLIDRFGNMLGAPSVMPASHGLRPLAATALATLAFVVAACFAWRAPQGRRFLLLFASVAVPLLAAPSYYSHYAAAAGPVLALVMGCGYGAAVQAMHGARLRRAALAVAVVVVVVASAASFLASPFRTGFGRDAEPLAPLQTAMASVHGCITSDDPTTLLLGDALGRDLTRGCPFQADTTGWLYDAGRPATDGLARDPRHNAQWQAHALEVFGAGDAVLLVRKNAGLSPATIAELRRGTTLVVWNGHPLVLRDRG